jgi:uncharacterized membrane protein YdjX (TVP38/TMEM64 family)
MGKNTAVNDDGPDHQRTASGPRGIWRYAPLAAIAIGLSLGFALGWTDYLSLDALADSRQALRRAVADNPVGAPIAYGALYAALVALSFPTPSLLAVLSGFLFGWLKGALIAALAATAGAIFLFVAARSAFAGHYARLARGFAARLSDGFRRDAFGYLLMLRIAPFIPFVVVSIAPALFNVRLRTFVVATIIGVLPGAFSYAWLGEGVDSVIMSAKAAGRDVTLADLVTREITIAFAILALVAMLATVVRRVWIARDR